MLHFASRRLGAHARSRARFVTLGLLPLTLIAQAAHAAAGISPDATTTSNATLSSTTTGEAATSTATTQNAAVLPTVSVSASAADNAGSSARSAIDPNIPASVETVTPDQFRNWNVVNTEDTLKYMPNLAVRKRFIGDLNST